jgi:hypothetical protein
MAAIPCSTRPLSCIDGVASEGIETLLRRLIVVVVDGSGDPVLGEDGQPQLVLRITTCEEA